MKLVHIIDDTVEALVSAGAEEARIGIAVTSGPKLRTVSVGVATVHGSAFEASVDVPHSWSRDTFRMKLAKLSDGFRDASRADRRANGH